jgi:hypothetical protein
MMMPTHLALIAAPLVAHALDRVPGVLLGLPLLVAASVVFAATRHEDPATIRRVTLQWLGWLGGVLGAVLVGVMILAWLA